MSALALLVPILRQRESSEFLMMMIWRHILKEFKHSINLLTFQAAKYLPRYENPDTALRAQDSIESLRNYE
jgi:hypothetical protein